MMDPNDILNFWADTGPERWWCKDPSFDASILNRFGHLYQCAAMGDYDDWEFQSPDTALALVIVLDQFSRNLHRDSSATYACDAKALAMVHRLMKKGDDRRMRSGSPLQYYSNVPVAK